MLIIIAALAICGVIQVVAICKIFGLRRELGEIPHLSAQPEVLKWTRRCRGIWFAAVLVSLITPVILHREGLNAMAVGLSVSTLLMIVAASIGDNSTSPGDGDSGG